MIGTFIGVYRITAKRGEGEVHREIEPEGDEAVKILPDSFSYYAERVTQGAWSLLLRDGLVISLLFLGITGCSSMGSPWPDSTATKRSASADVPYNKLDLKYDSPIVGAQVRVSGSDLPAGKTAQLP